MGKWEGSLKGKVPMTNSETIMPVRPSIRYDMPACLLRQIGAGGEAETAGVDAADEFAKAAGARANPTEAAAVWWKNSRRVDLGELMATWFAWPQHAQNSTQIQLFELNC
ncbi:MAG: hypothetical protein SynsKO_19560 [Synoicihabitans sp.]